MSMTCQDCRRHEDLCICNPGPIIDALQARVDALEQALSLYADADWWTYFPHKCEHCNLRTTWGFNFCKKPEDDDFYHPTNDARRALDMALLYADGTEREEKDALR